PDRPGARRRDPREQQAGRRHHLHGRASRGTMMRVPLRERARILIVEDDPDQAEALSAVLAAGEREILVAADGETGLLLARSGVELIVADYMLPGMNGVELVRRLREEKIGAPVLIVSGEATVAVAVEAMKAGVLDFVQKPFDVDFFRARVAQGLDMGRTAHELAALRRRLEQGREIDRIVGVSPAIGEVRRLIGTVARTDVDVALYGETGTGKELAARALHEQSNRGSRPFVVVDCTALPEPLLENELFGHEVGAFTGADRHASGLLAEADGGTGRTATVAAPARARRGRAGRSGASATAGTGCAAGGRWAGWGRRRRRGAAASAGGGARAPRAWARPSEPQSPRCRNISSTTA